MLHAAARPSVLLAERTPAARPTALVAGGGLPARRPFVRRRSLPGAVLTPVPRPLLPGATLRASHLSISDACRRRRRRVLHPTAGRGARQDELCSIRLQTRCFRRCGKRRCAFRRCGKRRCAFRRCGKRQRRPGQLPVTTSCRHRRRRSISRSSRSRKRRQHRRGVCVACPCGRGPSCPRAFHECARAHALRRAKPERAELRRRICSPRWRRCGWRLCGWRRCGCCCWGADLWALPAPPRAVAHEGVAR